MAYGDYEISVEAGEPVELFEIAIGTSIYRFNDGHANITISGDTYYNHQIDHSQISTGEETITVNMQPDHEYPQMYVAAAPGQVATITIRKAHRGDMGDIRVIYKGVIRTVSFSQDMTKAKLSAIPITAAFDKTIPDRTYQASCNHVLFSDECQIASTLNKHTGTVTSVNGNAIQVDGLGAKGLDWSTGGFIAYGVNDYRLVLSYSANLPDGTPPGPGESNETVIMNLAFFGNIAGETVTVYAGCDHLLTTCATKFGDNSINFGGNAYGPNKNVFESGIE